MQEISRRHGATFLQALPRAGTVQRPRYVQQDGAVHWTIAYRPGGFLSRLRHAHKTVLASAAAQTHLLRLFARWESAVCTCDDVRVYAWLGLVLLVPCNIRVALGQGELRPRLHLRGGSSVLRVRPLRITESTSINDTSYGSELDAINVVPGVF